MGLLGTVADDFTGATDVAAAFRRAGLRTLIHFGAPEPAWEVPACDAVVVALKTRTIDSGVAVATTRRAAERLLAAGADQLYLKYCSTFDSRPDGNIGPVLDDLAELVGTDQVIVCPSSPGHDRTVYEGQLFVAGRLLAESPMRDHPLTPMRDSSVVRLLQPQTQRHVGHLRHRDVRRGPAAVAAELERLGGRGPTHVVADALDDLDLAVLADAVSGARLVSGAAGLAEALGRGRAARLGAAVASGEAAGDIGGGRAAVLAGSCSALTVEQVEVMCAGHPAFFLDVRSLPDRDRLAAAALAFVDALPDDETPLIFSTLPPDALRATQAELGREPAAELVEQAMQAIAAGLVDRGFRRLVVAGGETSGAVVSALAVGLARVGAEIAPGVCWVQPVDRPELALLLKSGNFGGPELLVEASR